MAEKLPAELDYRVSALRGAVIRQSALKSVRLAPAAFGGALIAAGILVWWPLAVVGGVGVCVGFGGWALDYLRLDSLVAEHLRASSQASRGQAEQLAKYLVSEFEELGYLRAVDQIRLLKEHLEAIGELLASKFDRDDVSYQQFFGPAEVLYAQTLNQLKDAASQLRANQTYDPRYHRSARTGGNNQGLNRQKELHEEGVRRFEKMIDSVDTAMTGLAELTHDVAKIGSATRQSHDEFVKRVRDVASRATLYFDEKSI